MLVKVRSRKRWIALCLAVAATFLTVASANAHGPVHTYHGPSTLAYYGVPYTSGLSYKEWNRVYRPVASNSRFALWYTNAAETVAYQFEQNRDDNPFWHDNPSGYVKAVCAYNEAPPNNEPYWTDTTCQHQHS